MKNQMLIRAGLIAALTLSIGCNEKTVSPDLRPQLAANGPNTTAVQLVGLKVPAVENVTVATIGSKGGRMEDNANGHVLKIDPHTLTEPVEFTMTTVAGDYVQVELTARRVSDGTLVSTFERPVKLTLNWRNCDVKNPNKLTVVYLVNDSPGGALDPIPTIIDKTSGTAYSKLGHFSGYAMAIN